MLKNFHSAQFEVSAARLSQCPGASVPEIAFVGRSNAGKSTAINTLCNHRQLAYASRTPGRTQLLNFFTVQYGGAVIARLVDLPGYGFAQLSREEQGAWDDELGGYLSDRPSLTGCVIIVDARRGLLPLDWNLIQWLGPRRTPIHVVLSKADKLTNQEKAIVLRDTRKALDPLQAAGQPTSVQLWSALKKTGITELEDRLRSWIEKPALPGFERNPPATVGQEGQVDAPHEAPPSAAGPEAGLPSDA